MHLRVVNYRVAATYEVARSEAEESASSAGRRMTNISYLNPECIWRYEKTRQENEVYVFYYIIRGEQKYKITPRFLDLEIKEIV